MDQTEMPETQKQVGTPELSGFVATEHELVVLVKYWADYILDGNYFCFLYGQYCGGGQRAYAALRIESIRSALGDEATTRACREAGEVFKSKCDPREWEIYMNGTDAEVKALQEENNRPISQVEG